MDTFSSDPSPNSFTYTLENVAQISKDLVGRYIGIIVIGNGIEAMHTNQTPASLAYLRRLGGNSFGYLHQICGGHGSPSHQSRLFVTHPTRPLADQVLTSLDKDGLTFISRDHFLREASATTLVIGRLWSLGRFSDPTPKKPGLVLLRFGHNVWVTLLENELVLVLNEKPKEQKQPKRKQG